MPKANIIYFSNLGLYWSVYDNDVKRGIGSKLHATPAQAKQYATQRGFDVGDNIDVLATSSNQAVLGRVEHGQWQIYKNQSVVRGFTSAASALSYAQHYGVEIVN